MRDNLWILLAALAVSSVLAVTISCQKKTVAVQKASVSAANEDGDMTSPAVKSNVGEENLDASGIRETGSDSTAVVQEDIYFDYDKFTLTTEARESLIKNGEWLRNNPDVAIAIEGHCDERGTNEYNLALGDRRAESVKTFLSDLGIDTSRMTTVSYGEERPADSSHSEIAWAKNRRVHFLVK